MITNSWLLPAIALRGSGSRRILTFWGILEHCPVIILPGVDLELTGRVGFSQGVTSNHFDLAVLILTSLGNVEVEHAVVPNLEAVALHTSRVRISQTCGDIITNKGGIVLEMEQMVSPTTTVQSQT